MFPSLCVNFFAHKLELWRLAKIITSNAIFLNAKTCSRDIPMFYGPYQRMRHIRKLVLYHKVADNSRDIRDFVGRWQRAT